jgi:hypothetical protein
MGGRQADQATAAKIDRPSGRIQAAPPNLEPHGFRMGNRARPLHFDEWPAWLQGAPSIMVSSMATVTCLDGTTITRVEGQQTNCSHWRPGATNGRERYYYNGVVHAMLRVHHGL